ncbi:MPT63 family protein [Mycobacterium sp. SMC-4]|uniref:MPT63 family protein n=1 Tax=Mycobacterium sp. SMC-4 TaxID=2857059 RepID=UPI003D078900
MKLKPTWAAAAVAAAALAFTGAPVAGADADVKHLGQPGELVNGMIIQHWTITGLKPSTDSIPYQPAGTLWEATATDEAVSGSATPIISNLNARAKNGETYRVLFGVATEQGVNPSPIAQGQKTTGKIYFDVTGEQPDSVVYNDGAADLIVWVQPPPAPPSRATGSTPARTGTSPSVAAPAEDSTPAESAVPAEPAAVPATPAPEALPAGSSGTPLPEGSSGTPLPEGSSGTPLPEGAAPAAEPGPAPVPAAATPAPAPAPAGSAGTALPQGSSGTPLPEGAAPTTTVVPAPPA